MNINVYPLRYYLLLDLRILLMRKYPYDNKSSLKFYCEKFNIENKDPVTL